MVRKLKYHEQKLLRKVDFVSWEASNNLHENKIMKRYCIDKREEYTLYNKLSREIREIVRKIKDLDPKSPDRVEMSAAFLEKLYNIGLIPTKWNLENCDKINASSFCKRRLPVMMVRCKMAQNTRAAVNMVEAGHVRVGPEMVLDPAFLVPRNMEDFVTWVDTSKIRQHVLEYRDLRDDYDVHC
ncbi:U3 small nucleolar ribonucleoprotein protein IMP3 [Eurytemora carolleeae]|uniref:U3 small nucleolar ribonucleoprotein protein IMP3 n=1 Tax=Eurytemora carolleeae TaxID=1294199 RepID=UPI000C78550D|nr:U3 small nucleolar ribonucleoprotein protein IMP3 [Eurytemora carolleeae]|eukprot:XP_023332404.1 U3 small nucleolar ribonucleoprotein protein IMP3-like [Eurytemora affinis]